MTARLGVAWGEVDVNGQAGLLVQVGGERSVIALTIEAGRIVALDVQRNPAKLAPYESGVPQLDENRKRVNVRFYQIAMLFILFDIEVVFLYPVGVILKSADSVTCRYAGANTRHTEP